MRIQRPLHEDQYVLTAVRDILAELRRDPALRAEFVHYAERQGGAQIDTFSMRLYHLLHPSPTLRRPRAPTAYVTTLLLFFAKTKGLFPAEVRVAQTALLHKPKKRS